MYEVVCCAAVALLSCGCGGNGGATPGDAGPGQDGAVVPPVARTMYVTVGGEARLAVVQLEADGTMAAQPDRDLALSSNAPGAMTYARAARRLYIGVQPDAIDTVALAPDGAPSLVGTTDATGYPVYISLANDEATLVTAYFGDDQLRTFDAAGDPPHLAIDTEATAEEPHAIAPAPDRRRYYVPHRTPDLIRWYQVTGSGDLELAGELAAEPGVGPRHIAFSPDGTHAYIVNEFADSVSAHHIAADGALTRIQTITTLPVGADRASNTCADVHVTPDGRFVYASNRGHDSIAMFSIAADGTLAPLGNVPTEARPREFELSPDGRYVVVAGQDSGFLQSYRIGVDGVLTTLDRLEVGPDLRWVIID